jgi:hypothetical protein
MTGKAEFTEQEWDLIRSAPPTAGLIVITAEHGGTMRETFAMAKAYAEARAQHGKSELLDEIVASRPERDHTHYSSIPEMKEQGLQRLREAVETLQRKATPEEVADYRRFIVTLTNRVAERHEEHGVAVSPAEQAAINEIAAVLGASTV